MRINAKLYVNEKEVDRKEFEKEYVVGEYPSCRIEMMALDDIKEYEIKGTHGRICKIVIG